MSVFTGWAVALNGVILTDGCGDSQTLWDDSGCAPNLVLDVLDSTPDGLDLPGLRTEDVAYYQRDGVKHFNDWYQPRTIVLTGTLGPVDACSCEDVENCECLTIREQLSQLVQAWKRACCDTELVIYPPCSEPEDEDADRTFIGPYGVIGRPRGFTYKWLYRDQSALEFTAVFAGVDQRLSILDACGTPGYSSCVQIEPGAQLFSICMEDGTGIYAGSKVICMSGGGFCLTTPVTTDDSVDPTEVGVGGTEKVNPEIVLYPPLSRPYVENVTTGEWVQLDTTLDDTSTPVTINTEDGTAFDAEGNSLTHLLRGSLFLSMYPGNYEWRLLAAGSPDEPGYATLCWRDTMVNS